MRTVSAAQPFQHNHIKPHISCPMNKNYRLPNTLFICWMKIWKYIDSTANNHHPSANTLKKSLLPKSKINNLIKNGNLFAIHSYVKNNCETNRIYCGAVHVNDELWYYFMMLCFISLCFFFLCYVYLKNYLPLFYIYDILICGNT